MTARFFLSAEYALGYELLSVCSLEDRLIPQTVLSATSARGSLLDLGCADGRITEVIAPHFDRLQIVEPNPLLFSLATARLGQRSYALQASSDLNFETNDLHDLILASHMLYHIDLDQWPTFFRTNAGRLTAAGQLAVILWDEDSAARELTITSAPHRWLCSIEDLFAASLAIRSAGLTVVSAHTFVPLIHPTTLPAARLILRFLLGRGVTHLTEHEIEKACARMIEHGLDNKQTLVVLQRE